MNPCTPEEVGFSSARLARIRPALQAYIDAKLAPGFQVAIARRGRLVHLDCFGWQDVEGGLPMRADALFRIYSMTKSIATTALMMLFEEGRLMLEDPLWRYIPAFKNLKVLAGPPDQPGGALKLEPLQRDITLLDLTIHTAGLGYGLFNDSPVEDLFRAAGIFRADTLTFLIPLAEAVERIAQLPLANQPGQRWRYSIAIDVIGRLVEIISGRPFDVFLKERIFDPLSMLDTAFFVPPEKAHRLAVLYSPGPSGTIESIDRAAGSPFTNPPAAPSGGAGLVSSTQDYLRFMQMMLNGGELDGVRLLGPRTVAKMSRNHLPARMLPYQVDGLDHPGRGFGPGFGVILDAALANTSRSDGAFYWSGAASTEMLIDPREQMVAVLMTQVINNLTPFGEMFQQVAYQAIVE